MGTLDEIGARLESEGVGTVSDTNGTIFLGVEPAKPDELVAIMNTAGLDSIRTMGDADFVKRPSFTIIARASTAKAARSKVEAARAALHDFAGNLTGGSPSTAARYLDIQASAPEPIRLKPDMADRERWSMGFQAHKEPSV